MQAEAGPVTTGTGSTFTVTGSDAIGPVPQLLIAATLTFPETAYRK